MNFRTFFFLLFLISIFTCITITFFPNIAQSIIDTTPWYKTANMAFIGVLSLIISIFSYLGLLTSYYFEKKYEKIELKKKRAEALNLERIHEELEGLHKK